MLVSGKNVIAIDGVKTGNTLKGDGVFNTPGSKLDVNTDIIATKEFVTTKDDEVVGKINAASTTLSSKIDSVSSKLTTSAETLSANKQDKLEFGYNTYDEITAINTSALAGGNKVKIESTNSSVGITATTAQDTGLVTYDLSVSSETIINPTDVKGKDGIYATTAVNGDKTTFTLGLSSNYLDAIKKVSSNSAAIVDLQNNKLDKTASSNFYPMTGNPSGFLTAHQSLSSYYTKQQVDNKFISTSSWANTTFLTKNSADGLYYPLNTNPNGYLTESDISADKWNSVYTTVNTASGGWNLISSVSALTGIRNFEKIVVDIGTQDPIVIRATGSADNLSFIQGDNILFTKEGLGVKLSAKDTTYTSGNYIVISGDNNSINAVGLQPSGDYVSATDFNEFKEQVNDEFEQTSAWVEENFLSANALDEIKEVSANWNSVYETVQTNSGDWEEITKVKTFKTIGGINAETSADSLEFSAGENIEIGINEGKIFVSSHDTTYDENDFISASHLDNIVSVSSTVTSNSADWTSAARALEASADKWNTTHEQFNTSSVKWNELYDEYQVSSKLWNDTTDVVNTFSGDWNEVSAKANSADLEELSGKVETLSGELETASAFIEDQIDVLSGAIDNISAVFSADIDYISGDVEKKLYIEDFETWSAQTTAWDVTSYSAGKGLALNGHEFYVSAYYAMSADVYNKDEVDEKIAKFGGYTTANADASGYPDVAEPSTKFIYLVKMSNLPASSDNYKEWIYTSTEQTTAWECVGETTLDLTPYLTKAEASATYQPIGHYVTSSTNEISAVDEYYGLINDNGNVKWAKIPDSDTTYTAGKNIVISGNDNEISVSGLFNTTLSSQDKSIGISAIPDASGNITYNLSIDKVELPGISGISGISAYYDGDQYIVGLEDYNDIGFAKYSSSANVYTASAVVNGYTEDLNVNPTKITLNNDKILLKTGFYHVDVQTNFTIANPDNNYYNVFVKSIPNAASITQMIDGSYAHTETVDLSFDIRITSDDTPLEISVENFKTNETFAISNLNIHEIVSMPSQIEGGAGNYQAGDGISIVNDTIAAKLGNGLEIDSSNAIQVKLGAGLKFDDTQGVQAITIDNKVEEVVETVDKLQEELDTKITDNFPPAMITLADLQVATGTQYAPSNGGMLIGYLFTCPITHNIYVDNEKYKTRIGIYTKQWSGDNKKVILGIYEYDPDYNEGGQVGRTVALCDTGIIDLQQGYAEYDVKNVGKDASSVMTPGKFYYATIYLSYKAGDTNGITLFGAPGYNTQVNNLKPGITITNVNCIHAALYEGLDGYSPNLNFDQMGFSWQYNSYRPDPNTEYSSQDIVEAHAAGRPYFAIRNVKITGN